MSSVFIKFFEKFSKIFSENILSRKSQFYSDISNIGSIRPEHREVVVKKLGDIVSYRIFSAGANIYGTGCDIQTVDPDLGIANDKGGRRLLLLVATEFKLILAAERRQVDRKTRNVNFGTAAAERRRIFYIIILINIWGILDRFVIILTVLFN